MEEKEKEKKEQSVENKPLFGVPTQKDFTAEITKITSQIVMLNNGLDEREVVNIEYFNQDTGKPGFIKLWRSNRANSKWGVFNEYLKNAIEPFGYDIYDPDIANILVGSRFVFRYIQKRFGKDRNTGETIISDMIVPIKMLPAVQQQSQPSQQPAQPTQPTTTEKQPTTNTNEEVKEQPNPTEEKQQTTLITTPKEEEDNVTQHILEILKTKGPMIMGEIVLEFSKEPKWQFIPADVIFGKIADLMEKDIVKIEGNKIRMQ